MKRKIINIDDKKCNGCGLCIPGCPEGALQIIDGKARLISDLFCDGLGACLGTCPEGAITVEEREAEPYDERRVMKNIIPQGTNTIKAHLDHLRDHGETAFLNTALAVLKEQGIAAPTTKAPAPNPAPAGCPGARMMAMEKPSESTPTEAGPIASELSTWPVQLQLLNPRAPYLADAELLIAADCVPFALADFHRRFLKGKVVITFCPKLDQVVDLYIEKLAEIFKTQTIRAIHVVHMEVPCCSGTLRIIQEALNRSEKSIPVHDHTVSIGGEVIDERAV